MKMNKSAEHLGFLFQFRVEQIKDVCKITVEGSELRISVIVLILNS